MPGMMPYSHVTVIFIEHQTILQYTILSGPIVCGINIIQPTKLYGNLIGIERDTMNMDTGQLLHQLGRQPINVSSFHNCLIGTYKQNLVIQLQKVFVWSDDRVSR